MSRILVLCLAPAKAVSCPHRVSLGATSVPPAVGGRQLISDWRLPIGFIAIRKSEIANRQSVIQNPPLPRLVMTSLRFERFGNDYGD